MAKYKRRRSARYRRSFYSRGTHASKKGISVVVLVLARCLSAASGWQHPTHCWTQATTPGILW